jgi:hypothetical protein
MHELVCNQILLYNVISALIKAYSILGFDSIVTGADLLFRRFIVIIKVRLNSPIQQDRGFDRF